MLDDSASAALLPADLPDLDGPRAEAAATVVHALVRLRGGAPFLSSEDAAALVGWLDEGIPVARILRALDEAAARRRARRVRAPLQLRHAKRWLGRPARTAAVPAPRDPEDPRILGAIVRELRALPCEPALRPLVDALADDLLALPEDDRGALADAATARVVAFFDAAWSALGEAGREKYVARAAARLADVLPELDEGLAAVLLEEHARGVFRDDHPCLSLSTILSVVDP